MYRRNDPRFRRTLNEITQTFESANESAQANIFSLTQNYVQPCLSGVSACFQPCFDHCFPPRDPRARRARGRSQGRAESSFDFYDDWEEDDDDGLLAWGNDEQEGLLSGSGAAISQPARQRAMSYGTRRDGKGSKKSVAPHDAEADPTLVPASSYFGFFGKLTGKLGGHKALKYKPSAADLQERPGAHKTFVGMEGAPLLEESEDDGRSRRKPRHTRARSGTTGSEATADSLSSRGDIFPSEDEDDAVPLDDEFAMVLERRTTNTDEASSGRTRSSKRPGTNSRKSTGTLGSKKSRQSYRSSRAASKSPPRSEIIDESAVIVPSMSELKQEEEQARIEEEAAVARRREAAQRLALKRGLSLSEGSPAPSINTDTYQTVTSPPPGRTAGDHGSLVASPIASPVSRRESTSDTIPFPAFETPSGPSSETPSEAQSEIGEHESSEEFVPAQLPRFAG